MKSITQLVLNDLKRTIITINLVTAIIVRRCIYSAYVRCLVGVAHDYFLARVKSDIQLLILRS